MNQSSPAAAVRWTVLASGLNFPEGPAFDAQGVLWFVEYHAGSIGRLNDGGVARFDVGGRPNGIAFMGNDLIYCDAEHNTVRRMVVGEPGPHHSEVFASHVGVKGPNDLAPDRSGGLVFTAPGDSRKEPTGGVWRRAADGAVSLIAQSMYFPNGLAFIDEGKTLVVAETYRHRLWRGAWEGDCWLEPRPWIEVGGPIGPDGMALGPDGLLYVAIYGQGEIAAIDDSGRIARRLAAPGLKPTNVAFDPSGRLGLIVTEAERGLLACLPDWETA